MKKLLILLLVLLALAGCEKKAVDNIDVSIDQAKELIKKNSDNASFVILDVRTPEEYDAGHIDGAINIDVNRADFYDLVSKQDKGKTYLVYCRSGNRSRQALSLMNRAGITAIYHMKDGFSRWN